MTGWGRQISEMQRSTKRHHSKKRIGGWIQRVACAALLRAPALEAQATARCTVRSAAHRVALREVCNLRRMQQLPAGRPLPGVAGQARISRRQSCPTRVPCALLGRSGLARPFRQTSLFPPDGDWRQTAAAPVSSMRRSSSSMVAILPRVGAAGTSPAKSRRSTGSRLLPASAFRNAFRGDRLEVTASVSAPQASAMQLFVGD